MAYTGKYLFIDLTNKIIERRDTDKELVKKYIGGKGLGFAILDKIAPNPDPLGEDNPLIFVNGPFTGTKVQTSARTTLVTKSPLTNGALDTHVGGNFGPRLKAAGLDYMIIVGKSEKPVYLYVTDKEAKIEDATQYWGKGIFETTDILTERYKKIGKNPRVAIIGQAGENLSRMACIGVDKHRQYGRGGAGAVMGSKNLKGIVADGNYKIEYLTDHFNEVNKRLTKNILADPGVLYRRKKGTMKCVASGQELGYLPTKNHQLVHFDDWYKINSEAARIELNWVDTSCYNCGIRCSKWAKWDDHVIEGPEYETAAFLGADNMVNNIKDIAWANEICNDLGLDTISAGITIAFAMEVFEKKLLDKWNGFELKWGDAVAQREMLFKMAFREGVGAIFADGTKVAAKKIGKGSEIFAINTYGMELSGISPKGSLTQAIIFGVADFASHTRLWMPETEMGPNFTIEDIPQAVADGLDTTNIRNSLVICDFVPLNLDQLAELLNAAIDTDYTGDDLLKIGGDIDRLSRIYNLRNGRSHKDDKVPERFFTEKSLAGFMEGQVIDRAVYQDIIQKYYALRKWDTTGVPMQ
jgi:aldehyde:ferredoxin oxidoreductase